MQWRGESDSNRRERMPSKRTIGANATIIAGNCNVIIGTPAFAIRMAVINLLQPMVGVAVTAHTEELKVKSHTHCMET